MSEPTAREVRAAMLIEKTGGFDRNNLIYVIDDLERAEERVYAAERRLGLEAIRADRAEERVQELEEALNGIADAVEPHAALQEKATDPRVGLTHPITVAEGTALVEALQQARAALKGVNP